MMCLPIGQNAINAFDFKPMEKEFYLYAVGDVAPKRSNPHTIFDDVRPLLQTADIAFCQLETVLSKRGTPVPQARLPMRSDPEVAAAIEAAGFNVVSFAGNHCLDWGRDAFIDTLHHLQARRLTVIGAGENIAVARRPGIIKKAGVIIAFLAYNTILPQGYRAAPDRPGCTPLRGITVYEHVEHDQPGTSYRVHSAPHRCDLLEMISDIETAKSAADIVIVSMHWGLHFVTAQLADYQRIMAHTAIDHGADLILGHHPHILKGVDVYKNKVIFYSLGNFAIEQPAVFMDGLYGTTRHKEIESLNSNWQPEKPYALPPDTRKTIVVRCMIGAGRIRKIEFFPCYISTSSVPQLLAPGEDRYSEVVRYLEKISADQNLHPHFRRDGEAVVVDTSV